MVHQNPVIAGIYSSVIDANLARNLLELEGIKAMLADDQAVGMAWQMSTAMGGVKVLVRECDQARAEAILTSMNKAPFEDTAPGADSTSVSGDNSAENSLQIELLDQQDAACNDRERMAEAAWKATLVSLLFLPLQLYVFWMLLQIMSSDSVLRPRFLNLAWRAACVNIPALFVLACIVSFWFRF